MSSCASGAPSTSASSHSCSGSITSRTVLATGPVFPPAPEILAPFGELVVAPDDTEATLLPLVRDAVALIARGGTRIGAGLIEAAPELRVIGRTGVGIDLVDLEAATRHRIPVVISAGAGTDAVAEGALAMIVALAKRLPLLDRLVREGRWRERDDVEICDLAGSTLGIVGLGRIGRRLGELARPLGMRVVAYDPYVEPGVVGVEPVGLPDVFAESDFVSLHAPLNLVTRGMVDADLLAGARPGLVLVNLGRGGLVRSLDDLLAALESGRLGGVGLDVFDPEPPDLSHPLFRHPRVLLSPHALGWTPRARERTYREMAEGMAAVLRGERAAIVANPEAYEAAG
jgi:D-3-phosphoglycerate dehydrogenase